MNDNWGDDFKDLADLVKVVKDDNIALQCWHKGIVASDFEAYKGLPVNWALNLLDFEKKSIYTRERRLSTSVVNYFYSDNR